MRLVKSESAAKSSLVEVLRGDIVRGRLQPGQRLKAALLARDYGASLTVVREALSRLAGEQLVDFEPQMGFAVRQLSAEDLSDLVDQRVLFESIALRRCMASANIEWQSEVLAAHHRMARTPMIEAGKESELNPQWVERHDEFHSVVLNVCGSARLFRCIRQMAQETQIYHRALLPVVSRDEEVEQEHAQLVDAILSGECEQAVQLLVLHQERTRDVMLPLLKNGRRSQQMLKTRGLPAVARRRRSSGLR
jgi:GntR family carbon starvation induced transcriptional regulator